MIYWRGSWIVRGIVLQGETLYDFWDRMKWQFWIAYLDDFVTWEIETRNIRRVTGHEVPIEDTEDGFVSNKEEIILLTFEFEDDGFEADCEIVV